MFNIMNLVFHSLLSQIAFLWFNKKYIWSFCLDFASCLRTLLFKCLCQNVLSWVKRGVSLLMCGLRKIISRFGLLCDIPVCIIKKSEFFCLLILQTRLLIAINKITHINHFSRRDKWKQEAIFGFSVVCFLFFLHF